MRTMLRTGPDRPRWPASPAMNAVVPSLSLYSLVCTVPTAMTGAPLYNPAPTPVTSFPQQLTVMYRVLPGPCGTSRGAPAGAAGQPEADDLLAGHHPTAQVGDDPSDNGDGCLEHGIDSFSDWRCSLPVSATTPTTPAPCSIREAGGGITVWEIQLPPPSRRANSASRCRTPSRRRDRGRRPGPAGSRCAGRCAAIDEQGQHHDNQRYRRPPVRSSRRDADRREGPCQGN